MDPEALHDMAQLEHLSDLAFLEEWRREQRETEERWMLQLDQGRHKNRFPLHQFGKCLMQVLWGRQRTILKPEPSITDIVRMMLHRWRGRYYGKMIPEVWERACHMVPEWREYYHFEDGDSFIVTEQWVSAEEPFPYGGFVDVLTKVSRDGRPYDVNELKAPYVAYPTEPYPHYEYQAGGYFEAMKANHKDPQRCIVWVVAPEMGCTPFLVDMAQVRGYMALISHSHPFVDILRQDEPPTIDQIGEVPGPNKAWMCSRCDWLVPCRERFGPLGGESKPYDVPDTLRAKIANEAALWKVLNKDSDAKLTDALERLVVANPTYESVETPLVSIHAQKGRGGGKHFVVKPKKAMLGRTKGLAP